MHLVTASAAPAASLPKLGSHERYIGKPKLDNGVAWQTYEDTRTFLFGFAAATGFIGAGEHETAARADKEARRWCAAFVHDPAFEPAPALDVVGAEAVDATVFGEPEAAIEWDHDAGPLNSTDAAPAIEPLGAHEIAGWRIEVSEGRPGTFKAELFHAVTGKAGALDQNFTGKDSARTALTDASIWAMQHAADVPRISAKIDGEVVEEIHGEADPETELWEPDAEAAGWRIFATATGDKWALDIIDAATGDRAQTGGAWGPWHDTRDDAVEAGTTWAIANPTDAAVAEANELWSHVDAACRFALEADMFCVADRLDQDATDLRAELARVTRERDEARAAHARDTKACNAVAVDLAWNTKRKGELEARIADDRDELKSVVKRLKELETEVKETLEAVGKGKQVPLFPTVTIDGPKVSSPTVTSVTFTAGDRKKLDAALRDHDGRRSATTAVLTTTWHHGGVDYALESSELPGGQWRSCIHGHEVATEAFERSRDEAEAACKAAAVVVFEMKIGGTSEAVAAAMTKMIDPAVRMPAKRGRKPRAKAGAA